MDFQQLFGELRSAIASKDNARVASIAYQMKLLSVAQYNDQAQHIVNQYIQGHTMTNPYTMQRLEAIRLWAQELMEIGGSEVITILKMISTYGHVDLLDEFISEQIAPLFVDPNEEEIIWKDLEDRGQELLRTTIETPEKVALSDDIRDLLWCVIQEYELQQAQENEGR